MTDRTCLEVAADALKTLFNEDDFSGNYQAEARAALDAIHPALVDLTPDDVAAIFDLFMREDPKTWSGPHLEHAWEVLSRD